MDKVRVRLSFSNVFRVNAGGTKAARGVRSKRKGSKKARKSSTQERYHTLAGGNTVQIPLHLQEANINARSSSDTSSTSRSPSKWSRWTVAAIDLPSLLELSSQGRFSAASFKCLRAVKLCSTIRLRGVYTSDNAYAPFGPREMPRAMRLPLQVSKSRITNRGGKMGRRATLEGVFSDDHERWEAMYDWKWVPEPPPEIVAAAESKRSMERQELWSRLPQLQQLAMMR